MPVIGDVPGSQNAILGGSGMSVTITAPATGSAITDCFGFALSWTSVPSCVAYRVQIARYSDNKIIYDTGYVVKTITEHIVDGRYFLDDGSYYLTLITYDVAGDADTDGIDLTFSFQSSYQVTNLAATAVGMIGMQDTKVLPRVILTWSNAALSTGAAGAVVWRSKNGEDYIPIATLPISSAAKRYEDASVVSGNSYSYFIGSRFSDSKVRKSNITPVIPVSFEHCFIHAIPSALFTGESANAYNATFVRFESWEHEQQIMRDMNTYNVAGRRTPVAKFGELSARKFSMRGLPQERQNGYLLDQLQTLLELQAEQQYTLCMRIGRDKEIVYGALGEVTVASTQVTATASIDFTETFYDEDIRHQLDNGSLSNWREL